MSRPAAQAVKLASERAHVESLLPAERLVRLSAALELLDDLLPLPSTPPHRLPPCARQWIHRVAAATSRPRPDGYIATCKLHGVNPFDYLRDVLVRVAEHPARDVLALSPKRWKQPAQNLDAPKGAAATG